MHMGLDCSYLCESNYKCKESLFACLSVLLIISTTVHPHLAGVLLRTHGSAVWSVMFG